jgi:hypothetical protein
MNVTNSPHIMRRQDTELFVQECPARGAENGGRPDSVARATTTQQQPAVQVSWKPGAVAIPYQLMGVVNTETSAARFVSRRTDPTYRFPAAIPRAALILQCNEYSLPLP